MKFSGVAVHIRKVFNLVCLDKVFELYDDLDTALRSFDRDDKVIAEIQKKQLRRRFKRLPLDIRYPSQYKSKKEAEFHQGKILNISGVGMLEISRKRRPTILARDPWISN